MDRARIEALLRAAAASAEIVSFAGGLPAPETFPRRAIARAAREAILEMGTAPLQYDWPEGRRPLREAIAARLRARGADVEADELIITNGAQDAIAIAVEALAPVEVQVDALSYPSALELFRALGGRVTTRAAAVRYAMPAVSNPLGRVAGEREREEMLNARFILEDDAYADLGFSTEISPPLCARARDRVFHLGTFSKTLLPGLRVGWLAPPRAWLGRVRETKMRRDLHACGLAQAIVERFLLHGDFDARLARLRAIYSRRCERLCRALAAVAEHGRVRFAIPRGGFSVWVESELRISDEEWLARALDAGVAFDPGALFAADPDRAQPLCMRLSFSALPEDQIETGVARLAAALDDARYAATNCRSTSRL